MRATAFRRTLALIAAILAGVGCAPLLVGGVATSASVINDRRPAGTVVNDALIKLEAEAAIRAHRTLRHETHVDVTSVNGVVLLTGEARTDSDRDQVLTLVRNIDGVRKIIDQLRIAPPSPFSARLNDSWITLRVKAALFAHGLDANRIKVVTAHRAVYLLGLVRPAKGNEAALIASHVPNVRSVIELFQYVRD